MELFTSSLMSVVELTATQLHSNTATQLHQVHSHLHYTATQLHEVHSYLLYYKYTAISGYIPRYCDLIGGLNSELKLTSKIRQLRR